MKSSESCSKAVPVALLHFPISLEQRWLIVLSSTKLFFGFLPGLFTITGLLFNLGR